MAPPAAAPQSTVRRRGRAAARTTPHQREMTAWTAAPDSRLGEPTRLPAARTASMGSRPVTIAMAVDGAPLTAAAADPATRPRATMPRTTRNYPRGVPLQPGAEAPPFELPSSDDGATRSLDDIAGDGPALLAFFKTGYPTCQMAFPVYGELERRHGHAVPVVAVSQDPLAKTVPWLGDKGFAGLALDDHSHGYSVSEAYAVATVPTLILVEGKKVAHVSQGWDRDQVNEMARALGERSGGDASAVSSEGDGRPAFRPG